MDFPKENLCALTESAFLNSKSVPLRAQIENMLHNAILMTEMGMDLKERCNAGEKYVCYLRSLSIKAGKTINSLQSSGKSFISLAQKLITALLTSIERISLTDPSCYTMKIECEKLLSVIEKELIEIDDVDTSHTNVILLSPNIEERIKYLEAKQKLSENSYVQHSGSVKSVKSDVDEKYPENLSRDSLIDLDNVTNLPPVPEDTFTTFANKPSRTSSLSSLKGIRKVKLFLQRAANNSDEDDDSSELDEHECRIVYIYSLLKPC